MAVDKSRLEPKHEVTIKHRAFVYYLLEEDPYTGEDIRVERLAQRDEVVKLNDIDYQRGLRAGAFVTDDETPEEEELDIETATVAELADWIRDEKPNTQEVIDASGGDPVVASKLLEAENTATGGNPRKGVVDGLGAVVNRGGQ